MIDKEHKIDASKPHIQSVMGKYGRTYYFRHDEYVGKSVFQYGEFSPEECEYIVALANERKGTVLDIGANIGCVTQALLAARHNVLAFEPQPQVYELLVRNTPTAVHYDCGLGSRESLENMPSVDYSKRGNFGGIGFGMAMAASHSILVKVRTLDSFNLQDVSLMKIDVEGFEEEVLRGAVETIARCKPIIYLEADRPGKVESLAKFIEALGYTHEKHMPPLFSPNNYFQNPKRIWDKNYVSINWVCRPK